jgi:hypothetical protein
MILAALTLSLLAVGADTAARNQPDPAAPTPPVLSFPEPGIDDTAAYQGYQTRFYRDSKQNTVQIYLEPRGGRAVLVWADAANESAGFTLRDQHGRPARVTWQSDPAFVADSGKTRSIEYRLITDLAAVDLGWFLLGSMRVERDFVYAGKHLQPFTAAPFVVAEESLLVADVARLPESERARHLALLNAESIPELQSRLQPSLVLSRGDSVSSVRVQRPSLDGRNQLSLEIRADPRRVKVQVSGRTVSLRTRPGARVALAVKVTTDAVPLSPLQRDEIFNQKYLTLLSGYQEAYRTNRDPNLRRTERQVRAVELLSAREKLMAGLPNFATYFGRDMMMTALMMRPIWTPAMSEHVIASVLRKLGPNGEVSHEEALGGQAIRENAVVYDSLIGAYFQGIKAGELRRADSSLSSARNVLRDLQATRENYHMIDDEFQLPVLAARYLSDSSVPPERKRAFLSDTVRGSTNLTLLLRELALVARLTRAYVERPGALNLVSFPKRDSVHWRSASWRDSDAGYAGGRFAMDVNAIWAPQALEAVAGILVTFRALGVTSAALTKALPGIERTPLGRYAGDSLALRRAIDTWRKARRHFEVTLSREESTKRIRAKLAWLPKQEWQYWDSLFKAQQAAIPDSVTFLALSLDSAEIPIPVVNTDPATALFLEDLTPRVLAGELKAEAVIRDVAPFVLPYPAGLLMERLGPLAANDAYAPREIWERFQKDQYHGPRVVWGREVNLTLMGIANQIDGAYAAPSTLKDPALRSYAETLYAALGRIRKAAHESGLEHNELWSYRIEGGRLQPVRYGSSSDIQLWNTTSLAVSFVTGGLPPF